MPARTYPNVPKIAIGTPHAADVPIAEVRLSPEPLKYGTEKVPPPMPKIEDKKPIPEPTKIDFGLDGTYSVKGLYLKEYLCQ